MNRPVVAEPALLAEAAGDVMCAPSAVTMRREGRRRIPGKRSSCGCLTKLKEECCVRAAVFDSSVSGSVVLQPAACLCSVNATAHAQIRRLELCTFSAQFSPFLLPFIAPSARRSTHNSLRDAAHDDVRADPLAGEWKAVCFMFHCLQKKIKKNP